MCPIVALPQLSLYFSMLQINSSDSSDLSLKMFRSILPILFFFRSIFRSFSFRSILQIVQINPSNSFILHINLSDPSPSDSSDQSFGFFRSVLPILQINPSDLSPSDSSDQAFRFFRSILQILQINTPDPSFRSFNLGKCCSVFACNICNKASFSLKKVKRYLVYSAAVAAGDLQNQMEWQALPSDLQTDLLPLRQTSLL